MTEQELFKEQESKKNINVKEVGEELWVFNRFWSQDEPIIKFLNWKGLPKYFIEDQIDIWQSLFWERCETEEIDMREMYEDEMK